MSNQKYSPVFNDEAVRQVLDCDRSVKEVSESLDVLSHNLYKWVKQAKPRSERQRDDELIQSKREILKLKAQLHRAQEDRAVLKKVAVCLARASE